MYTQARAHIHTYSHITYTQAEQQGDEPTTIYIPPAVIYRRFGFAIALRKLTKAFPTLHILDMTGTYSLSHRSCYI